MIPLLPIWLKVTQSIKSPDLTEGEILTTLWWNEQDLQTPELNFTAVTEESQINSLVESIVENLLIIAVVSVSLVIIVWILIRRRESKLINLRRYRI